MVRVSRDCKIAINELAKRKQHARAMQMYWHIKKTHMKPTTDGQLIQESSEDPQYLTEE